MAKLDGTVGILSYNWWIWNFYSASNL